MRDLSIILVLVPLLGSGVPASAGCYADGAPSCLDAATIHVSSAMVGRPPLVWSPADANLLPPAVHVRAIGRTIPLREIIGFRVAPVGRPAEPVVYNSADDPPGPDPGLTLVPLRPPPRLAVVSVTTHVAHRAVPPERIRRAVFKPRRTSKRRCP